MNTTKNGGVNSGAPEGLSDTVCSTIGTRRITLVTKLTRYKSKNT